MPEPLGVLNAALEGHYRIEGQLGEGGMATVYLAEDLRHGRKVALKVLRPELAAAVGAGRFLAEIRTTARLQHSRILPLYDSGEAGSFLFYVMPYVEGETLRARLDRDGQLPVEDAIRIATQVAEALHHAHRHGVIHRDIKPANVLLHDGDVLVADFGIALAVGASSDRLTETGLSMGTPQYMSPEQATGDTALGAATDIWSLGCMLYEMLAGEPPYTGSTSQAILGRIVAVSPEPVSERRRATPPNVAAVVTKALEKVPSDRFRSADEFARALADPRFRYGAATAARSRGWSIAIAGAFYLLGMATWTLLGRDRGSPMSPVRFIIPDIGQSTIGRSIAISPDGSLIAHGAQGTPLVIRRVADFGAATELVGGDPLQPFFSPDGRWVGYFEGVAQSVNRIPTGGGVPTFITPGTGARAMGGTWGDDDTIVFATTSGLYRVPASGGEPQLLKSPDRQRGELFYSWPQILPGGSAVLFTIVPADGETDGDGSIACLDLESGAVTTVLSGGSGARPMPAGHLLYTAGNGTLHAAPFDAGSCEVTGQAVELPVSGINVGRGLGAEFDIAPDGTLVYLITTREPGILVWTDIAGRVEELSVARRQYNYSRISPDGSRIAVDVGFPGARDLYILDVDRGGALRLTREPGEEFLAEWSTGGDSLYFSSNQLGGPFNIFRRAADGTGNAELVLESGSTQMLSDIAADGSLIVSETRQGRDLFDVMAIPAGGAGRVDTLLSTPASEFNADVSPDGGFIAYQSDASGQAEVYVSTRVGAARARWKVSIDGGEKPMWSLTGDTLFFRSKADSMVAATLRRSPAFQVVSTSNLFALPGQFGAVSGRAWDVSPRDGRFLLPSFPPPMPGGIRVVIGFGQELRQAMRRR